MFWCFHCYALNEHATGPCDACGQPVEPPAGLSRVDGLVWALGHPDTDRATLGRLSHLPPVNVRDVARRALAGPADDNAP